MAFFVPLAVGAAAGALGTSILKGNSGSTAQSGVDVQALTTENTRLKERVKEMQEQIDALSAANKKHRDEAKDSDDELEKLEDELQAAKKELKTLKEQNSSYEATLDDYKMSVASLQAQLAQKGGNA